MNYYVNLDNGQLHDISSKLKLRVESANITNFSQC